MFFFVLLCLRVVCSFGEVLFFFAVSNNSAAVCLFVCLFSLVCSCFFCCFCFCVIGFVVVARVAITIAVAVVVLWCFVFGSFCCVFWLVLF